MATCRGIAFVLRAGMVTDPDAAEVMSSWVLARKVTLPV
jgi:hypothetical protein